MRKKLGLRYALAGAVLLAGGISLAAEDPAAREQTAIDGLKSANAMSVRDGVYVQTRDVLLTGSGSIKAQLDIWETGAQQWMTGWMGILSLADLKDNVPYATFEAALTAQLKNQATQIDDLTRQAAQIKAQGTQALARFGNAPGPGSSAYPGTSTYAAAIDGLVGRETELKAALTTMTALADSKIATLRDLDTRSRVAILSRLRAALLAKGRYPLEQTLTTVHQLLDAQKVIDPLLAAAAKMENDLDRQALGLQIFHVKAGIVAGNQHCATVQSALNGVAGAANYVSASRTRLNQLCGAMEDHHQSLVGLGMSNAELVAFAVDTDKAALQGACVHNAKPEIGCEKLATVAALKDPDYQSMDDTMLQFVEYGWTENLVAAQRKGAVQ
jgi:hypothetical protein